MNRLSIVLIAGLVVAAIMSSSQLAAAAMGLTRVGVGAYGISNTPIVQDDAATGALFGVRGRIGVLHLLAFEPSLNFLSGGEVSLTEAGHEITMDSPDLTNFSLNLIIGGLVYGTAGIGWTSVDLHQPGTDSTIEPTYNFGGGIEIPVGPVAVDAGARLLVINTADRASRKNLLVMVGANYDIF